MQTVLYFTLYHEDSIRIKSIVSLINATIYTSLITRLHQVALIWCVSSDRISPHGVDTPSPIRILDSLHTSFICAANWEYLIVHWGQDSITDYIPW